MRRRAEWGGEEMRSKAEKATWREGRRGNTMKKKDMKEANDNWVDAKILAKKLRAPLNN